MFHVTETNNITIDGDLAKLIILVTALVLVYFFSYQILTNLAVIAKKFSQKLGTYSVTKEHYLQRYVYQHRSSPVSKLYSWLNEQCIALGIKRQGVTPFGYFLFWAFIALIGGVVVSVVLQMGFLFTPIFCLTFLVVELIMTRVVVSSRMQRREIDIMDAVDLIIPEIHRGVKNSIIIYQDNFKPSVIDDFKAFVSNVNDRGFSFEDAMYMLADSLGLVFVDFAQKAVYYETLGEPDMVEIFTDIVETNRFRRQLRDENEEKFIGLTVQFVASSLIVCIYFVFLMITDTFSRNFFLKATAGKLLLIVILLVIFGVLAYITTIKSSRFKEVGACILM